MNSIIINANSLDALHEVADNSVSLICIDPPYHQGLTSNGKKASYSDLNMVVPFYRELFRQYKRVLKKDGLLYMFCDFRSATMYYPILEEFFRVRNKITWNKGSGAGNHYSFSSEEIYYCSNPEFSPSIGGANVWDCKSFSNGAKRTNGAKEHDCQKPVELIERIIRDSTQPNDLVLDTFAGSGTTAIACINLDRRFIGYEIDPATYEIAVNRISKAIETREFKY